MAREASTSLDLNQFPKPGESFEGFDFAAIDERFEELEQASKAATEENPTGFLMYFAAGDGAAIYRVTKAKPLTLQHVYVHDGWQVPAAHIRGIRMADVREAIRRERDPRFPWNH